MAHSILYFGWLSLHCHKTDKLISAFFQWFNLLFFFFYFLLEWSTVTMLFWKLKWRFTNSLLLCKHHESEKMDGWAYKYNLLECYHVCNLFCVNLWLWHIKQLLILVLKCAGYKERMGYLQPNHRGGPGD